MPRGAPDPLGGVPQIAVDHADRPARPTDRLASRVRRSTPHKGLCTLGPEPPLHRARGSYPRAAAAPGRSLRRRGSIHRHSIVCHRKRQERSEGGQGSRRRRPSKATPHQVAKPAGDVCRSDSVLAAVRRSHRRAVEEAAAARGAGRHVLADKVRRNQRERLQSPGHGMEPDAERSRIPVDVDRPACHDETDRIQGIDDLEVELPLVSGLRSHSACERDRRFIVRDHGPVQPAHQPMDRVVPAVGSVTPPPIGAGCTTGSADERSFLRALVGVGDAC